MNPKVIDHGGLWESVSWEIHYNVEVALWQYDNPTLPCKHCHTLTTTHHKNVNGVAYENYHCYCPRAVVAENEGGYCTTGVCLDCILEEGAK